MWKKTVMAALAAGAALALSGTAQAEDYNRRYEYFKDRPHPPHCEYAIVAHGRSQIAFFGGPGQQGYRERKAEERAIHDWSDEAAHLFGAQFADWGRAEGKRVHCDRRGTEFDCVAEANPCRENHEGREGHDRH